MGGEVSVEEDIFRERRTVGEVESVKEEQGGRNVLNDASSEMCVKRE